MQVTAPGNVYSYGVILLEILTTKLPVDEAFDEGVDLVKWVHNAPMRGETPEQILDARLSTVSFYDAWIRQKSENAVSYPYRIRIRVRYVSDTYPEAEIRIEDYLV